MIRRIAAVALVLGLWLAAGPARADAAPPGARRVDGGRYTVIHYPGDATLAASVLREALARDSFPSLPRATTRILIMIAPTTAVFREWAGRDAPPWSAALAFVEQHRIVMQGSAAPADAGDPARVLRHELAHIALYDRLGNLPPRWFEEGYASVAAGESRNEGMLSTNVALLLRPVPTLDQLDAMLAGDRSTEALAAYAMARRAVTELAAIDPARGLAPLFDAWTERGSFDLALRRAYAVTAPDFERGWQSRVRWRFALPSLLADSAVVGLLLLAPLAPSYFTRRAERRARLAAMRVAEAAQEDAARSAAVASLVRSLGPSEPPAAPDA